MTETKVTTAIDVPLKDWAAQRDGLVYWALDRAWSIEEILAWPLLTDHGKAVPAGKHVIRSSTSSAPLCAHVASDKVGTSTQDVKRGLAKVHCPNCELSVLVRAWKDPELCEKCGEPTTTLLEEDGRQWQWNCDCFVEMVMDAPMCQEAIDLALSGTAQKWLREERIRRLGTHQEAGAGAGTSTNTSL